MTKIRTLALIALFSLGTLLSGQITKGGGSGGTGTQGPTGPAGLTWRGAWSSSTTYAFRDAVSFGGSAYYSLQSGINHQPDTSATFWSLMAQKGDAGATGAAGAAGTPGGSSGAIQINSSGSFGASNMSQDGNGTVNVTNAVDYHVATFTGTQAGGVNIIYNASASGNSITDYWEGFSDNFGRVVNNTSGGGHQFYQFNGSTKNFYSEFAPQFLPIGTRPTCDATQRGAHWYSQGGTGVTDSEAVCSKNVSDAYSWTGFGGGSSFYQTVQVNGSAQTQRAKVNFAGTGITVSDNGTDTTTVTFPDPGAGGGSLNVVSSLPGTCTQGSEYFLTTGNPNAQIFTCSATNTLVQNGLLGGSGALSRDASTGALDIVPGVVPTLSGSNTFSGLVEAVDLKSTAGTSAPHACSVTADIGHFWTDTTDSANTHLKQCAATSSSIAWKTVY